MRKGYFVLSIMSAIFFFGIVLASCQTPVIREETEIEAIEEQEETSKESAQLNVKNHPDIPLPEASRFISSNIEMEGLEGWEEYIYEVTPSIDEIIDFYRNQMSQSGWTEINTTDIGMSFKKQASLLIIAWKQSEQGIRLTFLIKIPTEETQEISENGPETKQLKREVKVNEQVEEVLKTEVAPDLEARFEIDVTKAIYKEDKLNLAYSTQWASSDTIQKEMFSIVQFLSEIFSPVENKGFRLLATSDMGETIVSETSQEIQDRFLNLGISFDEWVQECILK